ncbi:MAG: cytochrome c3 family protein [Phycisphaerales bacterium]|nr:MAG: cytochrome c3 family protein [Phycisphaerales bacterium]
MFSKKFERRIYIAVAAVMFSGALGVSFGAYVLWPSRREAGYQPVQPIPFSHKLHAGILQIDCLYCHSGAEKGPHALVPPLSTCMNCHAEVQPKDSLGNLRPGIDTLLEHWENKEPIRWNKVHDVADFVYFDHSRHIAGEVTCQECHGPVERMEHVQRTYGLKMSWCLACHKQRLPEGDPAFSEGRTTRGPIHCTACHR